MNQLDFDFSKHVEVPEAWIDKALAIPSAAPVKPLIIAMRRRLIAAAVILPVLGLSLLLFFSIGNKNSIPVKPSPSDVSTVAPTLPSETPSGSANASTQPTTEMKQPASQVETQIATDSEGEVIVITRIITTYTEEAEAPSRATVQPSSLSQDTGYSSEKTVSSSSRATTAPTTAVTTPAPTSIPVPKPTSSATKPDPTEVQPPETDTSEIENDGNTLIEVTAEYIAVVQAGWSDSAFYCRVYDDQGYLLGDRDYYSPEHRMAYQTPDGRELLYYAVEDTAAQSSLPSPAAESRTYTYVIYRSNGIVQKTGTITV